MPCHPARVIKFQPRIILSFQIAHSMIFIDLLSVCAVTAFYFSYVCAANAGLNQIIQAHSWCWSNGFPEIGMPTFCTALFLRFGKTRAGFLSFFVTLKAASVFVLGLSGNVTLTCHTKEKFFPLSLHFWRPLEKRAYFKISVSRSFEIWA